MTTGEKVSGCLESLTRHVTVLELSASRMDGFASHRFSWSHAARWTSGVAALPVHAAGYWAKPSVSGNPSDWSAWWCLSLACEMYGSV